MILKFLITMYLEECNLNFFFLFQVKEFLTNQSLNIVQQYKSKNPWSQKRLLELKQNFKWDRKYSLKKTQTNN